MQNTKAKWVKLQNDVIFKEVHPRQNVERYSFSEEFVTTLRKSTVFTCFPLILCRPEDNNTVLRDELFDDAHPSQIYETAVIE